MVFVAECPWLVCFRHRKVLKKQVEIGRCAIIFVIPREVAESMRRILIDRRMDCSDYASLRAE